MEEELATVARDNSQFAPFVMSFEMVCQMMFLGFMFGEVGEVLNTLIISRYSIRTIGSAVHLSSRYRDFVQESNTAHMASNLAVLAVFATLVVFASWLRRWSIDRYAIKRWGSASVSKSRVPSILNGDVPICFRYQYNLHGITNYSN